MLAAQMFLGGAGTQIGWLVFGFGSIFFWIFCWHADVSGWRFREGATARVPGVVSSCRDTGYSVGGTKNSRGTPVYENHYRYTAGGVEFAGTSYDTGRCLSGEQVTVEYLTERPEYSRVEGMRRGLLGPWVLLVALLPGVGLGLAILGLFRGRLRVRLLRDGVPASGRVIAKTPTGSRTMNRVDYRVTVQFTAWDGSVRSVSVTTNRPEDLENGFGATVLHDPDEPGRALAIGGMPGPILEDGAGSFAGGSPRLLTLPLLSLVCNGWFIWRNWPAR